MNTRAWLIGASLPGLRALDIIDAARAAGNKVDAEAEGVSGIWLLMAAAIEPRIASVTLKRTPYSIRAAVEQPLARDLFDAAIPGFALKWDLSDLVALIRPRKVEWIDPTDWMERVKPLGGDYRYTPAAQ